MRRKRKQAAAELAAEADDLEGVPLFQNQRGDIAYLAVNREEPEEGYLGKLSPSATEVEIKKKWGGGTYTVTPRTARGNWIKGNPPLQVNIGGDPIFASRAAEMKWKRQQGIADEGGAGGGRSVVEKPLGFGELMLLMDKQAERARAMFLEQSQIRERESTAAHERQLEQIRAEAKRREAELAFERERLKSDAQEREQRLSREMQAERDRQREHNSAMLQLVSEKGKQAAEGGAGVNTLIAGIKLAQEMGAAGAGDTDPLTALAANLPDIIQEGGKLMAMEKAAGHAGKIRANPGGASRAARPGRRERDDEVTLQGPVGKKAAALVKRLEAQGKDPAVVLSRTFDFLERKAGAAPAPAARGRAGSRPAAAAPARAAARKPRRAPTSAAPKSPPPAKAATKKR